MSGKALTRLAIAALLSLGAYGRNAMTSEEMQVVHPKFRGASNPMIAELKTKMQKVSPMILAKKMWDSYIDDCTSNSKVTVYMCGENGPPICKNNAPTCLTAGSCLELHNTPAWKILTKKKSTVDVGLSVPLACDGFSRSEVCETALEKMCCDANVHASHNCGPGIYDDAISACGAPEGPYDAPTGEEMVYTCGSRGEPDCKEPGFTADSGCLTQAIGEGKCLQLKTNMILSQKNPSGKVIRADHACKLMTAPGDMACFDALEKACA